MLGQHGVSRGLLVGEIGIRGVDHGLLGDGAVKVGVALAVQVRQRITRRDPIAPVAFHLGEVAEQTEK
jgi:hypothetical protein